MRMPATDREIPLEAARSGTPRARLAVFKADQVTLRHRYLTWKDALLSDALAVHHPAHVPPPKPAVARAAVIATIYYTL